MASDERLTHTFHHPAILTRPLRPAPSRVATTDGRRGLQSQRRSVRHLQRLPSARPSCPYRERQRDGPRSYHFRLERLAKVRLADARGTDVHATRTKRVWMPN